MSDVFNPTAPKPEAISRTARRNRANSAIAWRMATVSTIVMLSSAATYPFLPRSYTGTADLLVNATNREGATTWDQSINDALDDNAVQTKIDILQSVPLQLAVIKQHNLLADPEFNTSVDPSWLDQHVEPWLQAWMPTNHSSYLEQVQHRLLRHLNVRRERKSYLIQIGYESSDPIKAAALTNTLALEFVAAQLGRKRESHTRLLSSLQERVAALEAIYHGDETVEHDFIAASGLLHVADKDSMREQITTLSKAVAEAHRKAVEAANKADMLNQVSQRYGGLDGTSDALTSPMLQRLREKLVELTSGAGALNLPAGASNSTLASLRQNIESESKQLVRAAQAETMVAQWNELALRAEIARLDSKLVQWQNSERKRNDLHRAVTTDLDALHAANERSIQESGRGDVLQADVAIVSNAYTPERPSFPNPVLYGAGTAALLVLLNGLLLLPVMLRQLKVRLI